ncbi:MAG: HD domain-containing protein [Coriobacteriia bacterium]|nr:HD domain-containing protein [Coriobacteriia bacterium]
MRIKYYFVATVTIAAFAFVAAWFDRSATHWSVLLFLGFLAFTAEWIAFQMPVIGSVSMSFSLAFAAVLLGGPVAGAIVVAMGAVSRQDIDEGKSVLRIGFNAAQLVLSALGAGYAYLLLGGMPLLDGTVLRGQLPHWLIVAAVAAFVYVSTNMLLVGLAISLHTHAPALRIFRESFRPYLTSMVALALLGIILAQLVAQAGIPGALLLLVPFVVARQTFQVYLGLAQAYRDTVSSLVRLLEAKDPYTSGHSARVAYYTRTISETIGLDSDRTQVLEFAALLHDIGKVGISAATLSKPASLSSEEYNQVKLHPLTGSQVLEDIDFLTDVAPLIVAHHERLDGSGYPYGLRGSSIPLGAQVLAVADTFDAMTTDRAYRDALPYAHVEAELHGLADVTLRRECVEALLQSVDEAKLAVLWDSTPDRLTS